MKNAKKQHRLALSQLKGRITWERTILASRVAEIEHRLSVSCIYADEVLEGLRVERGAISDRIRKLEALEELRRQRPSRIGTSSGFRSIRRIRRFGSRASKLANLRRELGL